jgi:L-asparaginase
MSSEDKRVTGGWIALLSLGGTIGMTRTDGPGVAPTMTAQDLVAAVPELKEVVEVRAKSLHSLPGAHLGVDQVIELARDIEGCLGEGAAGVVVTQGTDTIEEVAFLLDSLLGAQGPVVVTGAMRLADQLGSDGPANLLDAVRVAASDEARNVGTVIVMAGEIHSARHVQKIHATRVAAFSSPNAGPLGWVSEDRVRLPLLPGHHPRLSFPPRADNDAVALLTIGLEDDGRLLDAVRDLGYEGLVVEAMGAGHVPPSVAERLLKLCREIPVVLASRTGSGEVLRSTYRFTGSERHLLDGGLIPSGPLDGLKARLLLILLLRLGYGVDRMQATFEEWAT